jgi:hypothetical protein
MWCGNRRLAVRMYREMVRQWCLKNWMRIMRPDERSMRYNENWSSGMRQPRVCDEVRI